MLQPALRPCLVIALLVTAQQAARAQVGFPPIATDDEAYTVTYDETIFIDVLDNDIGMDGDLDPASVMIVEQPVLGTVSVDPVSGVVTYTPDGDPAGGYDMFEYTVADEFGQVSNIAWVTVTVEPNHSPQLIDFIASPGTGDVWHFYGTVDDEDLDLTQIHFGGILQGRTCSINPDGTFHFAELIEGSGGLVTAKAIDPHGLESNEEWDEVGY